MKKFLLKHLKIINLEEKMVSLRKYSNMEAHYCAWNFMKSLSKFGRKQISLKVGGIAHMLNLRKNKQVLLRKLSWNLSFKYSVQNISPINLGKVKCMYWLLSWWVSRRPQERNVYEWRMSKEFLRWKSYLVAIIIVSIASRAFYWF